MEIAIEKYDECSPFIIYESNIVPHKNEKIYLPHRGSYLVIDVIYYISDEKYDKNNLMFVTVKVIEMK